MVTINCPPGYIYNPDSGKCIKEDGVTAKKILKKYGSTSRRGACSGTVLQSAKGLSYCSTASGSKKKKETNGQPPKGRGQIVMDERLVTALREVKRTLVRKDERIRSLSSRLDAAAKTKSTEVASLEKQLETCEKRVDSLISQFSKRD